MARWIAAHFQVAAQPPRELGLREAEDDQIFAAACAAGALVLTKDIDFLHLLEQHGGPPKDSLAHLRQHFGSGVAADSHSAFGDGVEPSRCRGRTWWRSVLGERPMAERGALVNTLVP